LVSPSRKRRAAKRLVSEKGCATSTACRSVKLGKSSYYYERRTAEFEARLIARIRSLSLEYPRYGYRRMTKALNREGWGANKKRIQRLMRQEGLKVVTKGRKRRRLGVSTSKRSEAAYRGHVWSWDIVHDRTEDGRQLKFLAIVDEYTRECLSIRAGRHLRAEDVIEEMKGLLRARGAPRHIRSDNGPEFIAKAVCRWLDANDVGTIYIEPASPWENPYIESFNGKFRDECLNREVFTGLLEARVIVGEWRRYYNEERLHSSLGYVPPEEFAASAMACGAACETVDQGSKPPVATLPAALNLDMLEWLY
jgi:putative transposase